MLRFVRLTACMHATAPLVGATIGDDAGGLTMGGSGVVGLCGFYEFLE